MEHKEEDIKKKYPSLPPNYVSLAQLQERWIQQQQQQKGKEKEQEQAEQVASSQNQQQPKEKKNFDRNPRSSKNGEGRIQIHVRQSGERRVDAHNVYVPRRRQSDGNHQEIWETKTELKSEKLEFRASGDEGGNRTGNAKGKKYNQKKRRPRVKERINGGDPVQTLTEYGGMSGVLIGKSGAEEGYPGNVERSDYENERVQEIASVCMVRLVPVIKGKEVNSVGLREKSLGKQVVNDQFSSSTDSGEVEAKSLGKQVVHDQFSSSTDSWGVEAKSCGKRVANDQFSSSTNDQRVEGKSRGKMAVNVQFLSNTDDRGVEGSVNEYMMEFLPENGSEEEVLPVLRGKNGRRYNTEFERSGNDKGLVEEGNVCTPEVLQDSEAEQEVPGHERRKTGKERFRGRFQGNEGNQRMKRNSNDNKLQLELGQQLVEEGVFMGQKERNGPKARTGKGVRGYGYRDRVSDNPGPNIRRDFGDLSLDDSRKGNSNRGQRRSYGNFGRFAPHRKGKQVDGSLVWVKKEEISDANAAEIS